MRFLGNINCLKQDSMAYRIYDKLNSILKDGDDSLLYQQLQFWLSHLPLAKQAGQAGAAMTAQQQAVLHRQLSMIEDVIQQYAKLPFNPELNQDLNQQLL